MAHWLDTFDRDALIAKAVALGFNEAEANLWLDRLLASRSGVSNDKRALRLAALDALLADLTLRRDRTVTGRAWVVANAPNNAVKTATLQTLDEGLAALNARIARIQTDRDALAES